jgi:hypothetical protein
MGTHLSTGDIAAIKQVGRDTWNTTRLALGNPTATILRYTEYPNPDSLTQTVITNSQLNITENIVGRGLNLVEGGLDRNYTVTSYTTTSITVSGATFLTDGFTTACTFHIGGLGHLKSESPTKTQVLSVGSESLLNRDVSYYNITEKEMLQFNNELDFLDRRFLFYDIQVVNNDIIVLDSQQYAVYKFKYNIPFNRSNVYGKALREE